MIQVIVTTRHIDDRGKAEELKKHVTKKIKKLERLIEPQRDPSEIRLVLSVEKFRNIAELFIENGAYKATSSAETDDMMTAVDRAIDALKKQLRKRTAKKAKVSRRSLRGESQEGEGAPATVTYERPSISFEKMTPKPMSVEEAVLQLKVSEAGFITFYNSETGHVNVLYKKEENNLGLIAP